MKLTVIRSIGPTSPFGVMLRTDNGPGSTAGFCPAGAGGNVEGTVTPVRGGGTLFSGARNANWSVASVGNAGTRFKIASASVSESMVTGPGLIRSLDDLRRSPSRRRNSMPASGDLTGEDVGRPRWRTPPTVAPPPTASMANPKMNLFECLLRCIISTGSLSKATNLRYHRWRTASVVGCGKVCHRSNQCETLYTKTTALFISRQSWELVRLLHAYCLSQ